MRDTITDKGRPDLSCNRYDCFHNLGAPTAFLKLYGDHLPNQVVKFGPGSLERVLIRGEPDIYTAHADRDRAIILRWVLRDIKANRLKLSPVDQHDLKDLIDMGLVEMRNDAPVLTNTGVDAIL